VRRPFFGSLPVRHKLVVMIMLTSATVLLLASAGYLLNDYLRTRDEVRNELETQASLVLENAVSFIDFDDRPGAVELLRTLSQNRHLRVACLYDGRGRLFVEFTAANAAVPCGQEAPVDGDAYALNHLTVTRSSWRGGKPAGAIHLRSRLSMIWATLGEQLIVVLVMMLVSLGIALLLSARLQGLVSQPIVTLADTARQVSSRGDYSLRALRTTDDELGVLVDAFNRMLERIQLREQELSAANEELRHEVIERRRAEQERAELLVREREANRLKDEFLATLSHELRTPLNAIIGWTRLLRANAVPPTGQDRALEKVERNAEIQTRLVEDLLEISRIASGKLHLEIKEIDLVSIVNRAVDSIRPAAEARGVSIERRFDTPSAVTSGDGDRLQQVVWNLLTNAVKFTPSGGTVSISLERHTVLDELTIRDTGIGIDPAFLPHVFDTFRQADASSTRAHGGLGLGLSIVRHLVEMHGGAVEAQSDGKGTGSTFTVRLPVRHADTRVQEAPAHDPIATKTLAGATVLVVDDDADSRDLLKSVFESAGATVRAVGSAAEALSAAMERAPDALVSDIAMPGQDGCSLLVRMREGLGARAPRAAVAVTAFAAERDRRTTAAAGFDRHIAKPFDPVALVHVVEELLDLRPLV
jgi:signal transduction histidine kinase